MQELGFGGKPPHLQVDVAKVRNCRRNGRFMEDMQYRQQLLGAVASGVVTICSTNVIREAASGSGDRQLCSTLCSPNLVWEALSGMLVLQC